MVVAVGLTLLSLVLVVPLPAVSIRSGEKIEIDWQGRASLFTLGSAALL